MNGLDGTTRLTSGDPVSCGSADGVVEDIEPRAPSAVPVSVLYL